jgi:hypothetical protein
LADKTIGDLNYAPGSVDDSNTLFVVQQTGAAYKLDGHAFILALTTILDGHGGVASITYTAPTPPSLDGTMVITLADQSTTTVTVKNGKGISGVAKTGTSGLVDTYTITYNDATTSTFTVTNGAKGDTGDAWYVWIRYAGQQPTQDSDMGTTPDDWMGIYSGTSTTPPTHYTSYTWFQIKGEKGDTGAAASIVSSAVEYQTSNSGTVVPSGAWTSTVPTVVQGQFLWTRTTVEFNSGSPVVWYAVAYQAVDGEGSPGSSAPLSDTGSGLAGSALSYSREDHQHPLQVATSGTPQMDGTASLGTATTYARTDHRHPKDTSKQNTIDAVGILKGSGSSVIAATLGTDYTKVNTTSLVIPYASWTGSGPYMQTVSITGVTPTAKTKVNIQADENAIAQLVNDKVVALFIKNNNGTLTAYAIGAATTANITVQVEYYETV